MKSFPSSDNDYSFYEVNTMAADDLAAHRLRHQGYLLLTWFNLNPSMDKQLDILWGVIWNYLSIPKLQRWLKFGNG